MSSHALRTSLATACLAITTVTLGGSLAHAAPTDPAPAPTDPAPAPTGTTIPMPAWWHTGTSAPPRDQAGVWISKENADSAKCDAPTALAANAVKVHCYLDWSANPLYRPLDVVLPSKKFAVDISVSPSHYGVEVQEKEDSSSLPDHTVLPLPGDTIRMVGASVPTTRWDLGMNAWFGASAEVDIVVTGP